MRGLPKLFVLFSSLALSAALADGAQARSEEATVRAASDVLDEFLKLHIRDIPASLLADAKGVVIVPDLVKIGFVIGGQRGKGVAMVREENGTWRAPVFLTLTGGSIGWQAGAQASDIVLVFKTQKSVQGLLEGKFTLGADAAVAAGPVGRRAAAATDENLKAEIYSYSRSRGLFAGISIDGSVLEISDAATAAYYGAGGQGGAVPESALALVQKVARLTADVTPEPGQALTQREPTPATSLAPRDGFVPRNEIPPLVGPLTRPANDADALRSELAKASGALNPLLDQSWRRYLALPAETYQTGRHPAPEALAASLQRYQTISANPDYRALTSRSEFQTAQSLLTAYHDALAATNTPKLALPPPPGAGRR
jgi:lipid-binding SYLF domain-containing protein